MSVVSTPCVSCRASMTAFTIAGGDPTFGDSPTPLAPSGWCGHGVTVSPSSKAGHSRARRLRDAVGSERMVRAGRDRLAELEVGTLERRRDQVVHERRVETVALLVERD